LKKNKTMKEYPGITITVECDWEEVVHKIKWASSIGNYMKVFKSILRFNWYKEDKIKEKLWAL